MPAKGSRISRVVNFFREADPDEARVTFQLVSEIMHERVYGAEEAKPRPKKSHHRKPKAQEPAPVAAPPAEREVPRISQVASHAD